MNKFKIEIKETLSRVVEIEAESLELAIIEIEATYEDQEIVLDSSDFKSVEFNEFE